MMINDKDVAAEITHQLGDATRLLNDTIRLVQERCSDAEFKAFREGAGQVMGDIYLMLLRPLWRQHPELAPEGLDIKTGSKKDS